MDKKEYFKSLMETLLNDLHEEKELFLNMNWDTAKVYLTDDEKIVALHYDVNAILFGGSLKSLATSGTEYTIIASGLNNGDDKVAYLHFFYCGNEYDVSIITADKLLTIRVTDALFLQIDYSDWDNDEDLKKFCPLIAQLKNYAENSLNNF